MSPLAESLVWVSGLAAGYGNVPALDGVDLRVRPGELVGITGENGSGKSTLMRCLVADLPVLRGTVEIAPATRVALAWQEPALCDNLDIAANLLLGQEQQWNLSFAGGHARAREMLARLSLDPGRTTDLVGDLTGAQRQLLAVAKAALAGPDLLLLDEPTADLGVEDTSRVEELVQRLHAQGTTIVLVSHEVEQLFRVTQRVVVLRRGKVVGEVDPARDHPDDVVALMSGMELESSAHQQLTRLHALTDRLASADPSSSLLMILTALGTALGADKLAMHVASGSGEERLRLACCSLSVPEDLRRRWHELPYGSAGGPMGLAAASECAIVDPDIRTGPTWRPFFEPAWRAQVASSWAVPFAGTEGLRGVITVMRDRIGRPSRDELDLAYLYGGYAASAIERDRLVGQLTSRNLVLETIRDVLETLAGPVPLDEALGTALRALLRGVAADEAAVFSTGPDGSMDTRALIVAPGVPSPTDKDGWQGLLSAAASEGRVNGRVHELGPAELGARAGWGMTVCFASPDGVDTLAVIRRHGTPTQEAGSLVEDAAHSIRLALEREQAQRAMQETTALRRSEQLQRDFLARLSHELRTPLTAISGYADTLMQDDVTWDAASQDRFLSRIAAESQRLRRLVDDLLDQSAIESGVLRLQRDWCDLGLLLDAARSCLDQDARGRVHLRVSPDVPTIWADHDRLEQVFLNLLDNAVRHNPPDTQVVVRAWAREPDLVVVAVTDNGTGTPPAVAAAPFDPHRGRGRDGPSAGAGLGLSITRAIVVAHGGEIELHNAVPGTSFVITLPVGLDLDGTQDGTQDGMEEPVPGEDEVVDA